MSPWLLILTIMNTPATCQTVTGERIYASDLSWAIPAFSILPRDTIIGYSPAPGSRRVLQFPELKRLGMRYGVAGHPIRKPASNGK